MSRVHIGVTPDPFARYLFVSAFFETGWHDFDPYQRSTRPVREFLLHISAIRFVEDARAEFSAQQRAGPGVSDILCADNYSTTNGI